MNYFIDTEFCERGANHPIELISIGVVTDTGREFYACNASFNPRHASTWVRENVLPLLPERNPVPVQSGGSPRLNLEAEAWMPYERIGKRLREFVTATNNSMKPPQFWGYYCAYDYVLLSQLMGGIEGWPDGWPYMMHDLRQWLDHEALYHIEQSDDAPHNALQDARWIRDTLTEHHRKQWGQSPEPETTDTPAN